MSGEYEEERQKMMFTQGLGRDSGLNPHEDLGEPMARARHWQKAKVKQKNGASEANGTLLCTITVAAGKMMAVTVATLTSNNAVEAWIAESSAATIDGTQTDHMPLKITSASGGQVGLTEDKPLVVVDNRAGSAALYVHMYLPPTIEGGAANNNNNATHYVGAYMGGYYF